MTLAILYSESAYHHATASKYFIKPQLLGYHGVSLLLPKLRMVIDQSSRQCSSRLQMSRSLSTRSASFVLRCLFVDGSMMRKQSREDTLLRVIVKIGYRMSSGRSSYLVSRFGVHSTGMSTGTVLSSFGCFEACIIRTTTRRRGVLTSVRRTLSKFDGNLRGGSQKKARLQDANDVD